MTTQNLFSILLKADTCADVEAAITQFENEHSAECTWVPVGKKDNNSGPINIAADPGRSLVERLTNAVDAVLEREHEVRGGSPVCRTPREAASAWLGIPSGGLSEMTQQARRDHANNVIIRITEGEGSREARTVEVRDQGIGITPDRVPTTILSLNESNKWQKHYLAGTFGQGGSSTFAASDYTLIASRYKDEPVVGFTVVKYRDLPPDLFKTGHYVYLVLNSAVLQAEIPVEEFTRGTLVKHFGYDLTSYSSPLGPNSIYGLLNQTLFDPILPIWLDSRVHNYRRVIKGSRNALNGALDEGDEGSGPKLSHSARMFYINLGEFGQIGVEYWVLERPSKQDKRPSAAFVNPTKPIILTINGQNQEEMSALLIRKNSELPYLSQRLICHVDCNGLHADAKRSLFSSTREGARRGLIHDLIQKEIIRILRSDDELTRLNEEARKQGAQEMDQNAVQQMRKEVARILQMQGVNVGDIGGLEVSTGDGGGLDRPRKPTPPRPPVVPIPLKEPPTYIKILWDEGEEIPFHPEQRRYIRIETDAESRYHRANAESSPTNFIVSGEGLVLKGTTSLQGGRMRAVFEASPNAEVGEGGTIRVEMTRKGLPTLTDERKFKFVVPPPVRQSESKLTLPPFRVQPVEGPEDARWTGLGWPDDINILASSAEMENGELVIYYSTVFPRFASARTAFENRDAALVSSFIKRYEIWLAVHSFLWHRDQSTTEPANQTEEMIAAAEAHEQQERCRIATLSTLFASREARFSQAPLEEHE
ncbi:hypothetical protein HYW59_03265 [Candidatus Kaiserbacteria bacterium]|nr:hypothetical protein [Candidatus Kaiserbacteria bacterium]